MIGAIIGDIVGSRFEWRNIKTKEFKLFTDDCFPTDDSILTLAIAEAILNCEGNYSKLYDRVINSMRDFGNIYKNAGYGGRFKRWLKEPSPEPYNSLGNGAAMRVSPVAYVSHDIYDLKNLSSIVTCTTHNHPSGIKGAEATSVAIFMALRGMEKEEIRKAIHDSYYNLDFTLDAIRPSYKFDSTCDGTVPYAIKAFLESTSFEDAIRNAISIGGDSDTLAAIAGSIAEAYYGVPNDLRVEVKRFMDVRQQTVLRKFENMFGRIDDKGVSAHDSD